MVLDLRLARIECRETNNPSFLYINIHFYSNVFAKPNEQNDACIKSAMARKGGCEETNVFAKPNEQNDAMARMPKASRTEAALSPKGRGADSGGESEAAKGGCEETNVFYKLKAKPNSLNYAEKRMPKV